MDLKWIALAAIVGGIALTVTGLKTKGEGGSGIIILPKGVGMIGAGAVLALVGDVYLLVRGFIAI